MGITDGDWVCNLCGHHASMCDLCRDDPNQKVVPFVHPRDPENDPELRLQYAAMDRAARMRAGL